MIYAVVRVRRTHRGPLWAAWIAGYRDPSRRYFVRFRRRTALQAATRHFLRSQLARHETEMRLRIDG